MRPPSKNRLTLTEAISKYSKDYIYDLYYTKRLSTSKLAEQLKLSRATLYSLLDYYGWEKRQLYYEYDIDQIIANLDIDTFKLDISSIGAQGVQTKYKIGRQQFYKVCDKLNISYTDLIKQAGKEFREEKAKLIHEQRIQELGVDKVETAYLNYGYCGTMQSLGISRATLNYFLKTYGNNLKIKKNKNSNNSYFNNLFAMYLAEYNIPFEREYSIGKKRFDFKIGDLVIEINPNRTHNIDGKDSRYKAISYLYHQKKSLLAIENNLAVVHLYQKDNLLEFIKKYLSKYSNIECKIIGDTLYIDLDGFCSLGQLKTKISLFSTDTKFEHVIISQSLNFYTLDLNKYFNGQIIPPQTFYSKENAIVEQEDFIQDKKVHCISDAGKII